MTACSVGSTSRRRSWAPPASPSNPGWPTRPRKRPRSSERWSLAAREVIAIVDHTKWERAAFATFCATDQIGMVITDGARPTAMVGRCATRLEVRCPSVTPAAATSNAIDAERRRTMTATQPSRPRPRAELRGHLQAIRRDPGARRRLARSAARRGPRPGRRERRRQEHARQDPGRRPPARQRDDLARRRRDHAPRARPTPRSLGHRRRPPGAAPVSGPDRRRERVHRPRARPAGSARSTGARRAARRRPCSTSSTSSSTSARRSAACRWPTSS